MKADRKRLVLIVAILAICLSLISITRTVCGGGAKRDYRASEILGRLIAEETCKLIGDKGNVVVFAGSQGSQHAQLRAFEKGLKQKPGIKLLAVRELTSQDIGMAAVRGQVPLSKFREGIEKILDVTVIVSLLGPPLISASEYEQVSQKFPKFVAFAPMGMGIKDLLEEGIVQVAIVPRTGLAGPMPGQNSPSKSNANTPRPQATSLNGQYQVLTTSSDLSSFNEPSPPPLPPGKR